MNTERDKLAKLILELEDNPSLNTKGFEYILGYRDAIADIRLGIVKILNDLYGNPVGLNLYFQDRHSKD